MKGMASVMNYDRTEIFVVPSLSETIGTVSIHSEEFRLNPSIELSWARRIAVKSPSSIILPTVMQRIRCEELDEWDHSTREYKMTHTKRVMHPS